MNKLILVLIVISVTGVGIWSFKQNSSKSAGTQITAQNIKQQPLEITQRDKQQTEGRTNLSSSELKKVKRKDRITQRQQKRNKRREERGLTSIARAREHTPMTAVEKQELFKQREQVREEIHQEALNNLDSEDDVVRLDAVTELNPTTPSELELILEYLAKDQDPVIREEAAGMLSFGEYPKTKSNLIAALSDAEPKVVVAAVEALSWYDDDSKVIDAIKTLEDHTDSRVRDEVAAVLAFVD